MGTFRTTVHVRSFDRTKLEEIEALVDTGASYTTLPESLLTRLGVERLRSQRFILATGDEVVRDVGQTWVELQGREAISVVVFGDATSSAVVGAVTLEELGLGVDPVGQRPIEVAGYMASLHPWRYRS